jgi:hypothetical protein
MRPQLLLAVLMTIGCSRTPTESVVQGTAKAPLASTGDTGAGPSRTGMNAAALSVPEQTAELPFRFPAADRVVAVGDLHGDLASAREALRIAGAIDEHDDWVGGKLVLVQVGDQLDRGDDEPEILGLLEKLTREAAKTGGAVHVLNGNHELMNASGDLRYVTPDGLRDYAGVTPQHNAKVESDLPIETRGRAAAFSPGSELSRKLAARNTIAIVGDIVFAHAGVLQKHVRYGVGRINDDVRRFLRGESSALPPIVSGDDAPVWTRAYGGDTSSDVCRELQVVLNALGVKRMVVGHTVQSHGITSACNDSLYRVDVGLSDYYGKNPTQVLELSPTSATILSGSNTAP